MKEFFSHDYNSRSDPKLQKLQMKLGLKGIGAYWCIVEMLYEEGGYLPLTEYERITFELRTEYDFIKSVIQDYDLFKNDGIKFWSESAIDRLKLRSEKSEKARQSINKRWVKYERITDVLQKKYDSNTIKVKESKENIKYKNILLSEIYISDFPELNKDYIEIAKSFQQLFKRNLQEAGASTTVVDKANGKWIDDVRLMIESDKHSIQDLRDVFSFLQKDPFWKSNILSTSKLREQLPKLKLKIHNGTGRPNIKEGTTWDELAEVVHAAFNK